MNNLPSSVHIGIDFVHGHVTTCTNTNAHWHTSHYKLWIMRKGRPALGCVLRPLPMFYLPNTIVRLLPRLNRLLPRLKFNLKWPHCTGVAPSDQRPNLATGVSWRAPLVSGRAYKSCSDASRVGRCQASSPQHWVLRLRLYSWAMTQLLSNGIQSSQGQIKGQWGYTPPPPQTLWEYVLAPQTTK